MLCKRLTNARFLTMDPDHPVAHDLGILRGRIAGLDAAVTSRHAREVIDLQGATVLPGFIDAHVHLAWTGLKEDTPSIAGRTRVDDVLAVVAAAAARERTPGSWLHIAGYDQRALGRHLTAAELDTVSRGHKVYVLHDSGHGCVVNSAVLDLLPPGTPHENGFLAEGAMGAARALRLPYSQRELAEAIGRAARTCLAEGVTACAEAGIGGTLFGHSPVELGAYQLARDEGLLPLRVQLMVAAERLRPVAAHEDDGFPRALDLGLRTGFGDDWLSVGALKVYTDGGMMARTAALSRPYEGLGHAGQLQDDPDTLTDLIVDGHLAGWQLAVHAIGDRAADLALDALERAQRLRPRPTARHRIEHAGLIRPDQLPRFARLGVSAVVQPTFLHSFGDDYAAIMGEERAPWLYRGRAFLDHGIPLVGSSDRPVTDGAPLRAVQFMVERASGTGRVIGPAEGITVEEALHAYTVAGARACHWEDTLGTLTPGKRADLVVLGDDPRRVDTSRIGDIEVVTTYVEGAETALRDS
ncbi:MULTISPECIES: amidohydrolase [Streptomyces]|uniref:Amidohydrolase n=1 Tax=Streptomyces venezuelae TaxID=54571 RepID=A0A5P2BHG8_STRVZ|nr:MULTISPECIES: amidohydrolase [Streptomyces]NEA01554.1 amidohydrolase [Streptomyces sp. SID10116]MYY86346.1 amidohydrolase family protein [Streptomyces sp. SID335]MYZ18625.1 amidohydrolase family protein [Streptomyces sp. SID337]NDZ91780.1 amidohydrolase [Streptomyces sp. SID10115]NEB48690.1 amidohydrolase [Streptomyces sp. SID339]